MEHTLLIRLQGPMQAWGTSSRFSVRETGREPTRSGVIGLLCAALGRPREEPLDDFQNLRMGVRVDREGSLMVDFHTALDVRNAEGSVLRNAVLSHRYYLAGATFLAGLAGDDLDFLRTLHRALQQPRFLLSLGRKSFPPSAPLWLKDGLREWESLETALQGYPWLVRQPETDWEKKRLPGRLRFLFDDPRGFASRSDNPISFAERSFALRQVRMTYTPAPQTFINDLAGG